MFDILVTISLWVGGALFVLALAGLGFMALVAYAIAAADTYRIGYDLRDDG